MARKEALLASVCVDKMDKTLHFYGNTVEEKLATLTERCGVHELFEDSNEQITRR